MGVPAVVSTPDSQFLIEEIFLSRDTNSAHHNTNLLRYFSGPQTTDVGVTEPRMLTVFLGS